MEQLENCWTGFQEICYLRVVHRTVEQIQFLVKLDKSDGSFAWRLKCVSMHISQHIYWRKKFELKLLRKMKHILCPVHFLHKS
jgi:hypothetical protein